jgi:hypothetical protein
MMLYIRLFGLKDCNHFFVNLASILNCCEYKDGKVNENIPDEPQVADSRLARQHLLSGYEHAWNFYEQGFC